MTALKDLTGQRFGRLVARRIAGKSNNGSMLWNCICDCGKEKIAKSHSLSSGLVDSCGCQWRERHTLSCVTHGRSQSALYHRWERMKSRVLNISNENFPRYGARGISICERWMRFENFAEDMGDSFSPELSLERMDNEKGYSPENCVWATMTTQNRNKRNNRILEYEGEQAPLAVWAERVGIKYNTLFSRINNGWSVAEALEFEPRRTVVGR